MTCSTCYARKLHIYGHLVWSIQIVFLLESCRDEMLLEATTSAMGAVIQKLSSAETPKVSKLNYNLLYASLCTADSCFVWILFKVTMNLKK